jgi:hypothetical protein
MPDQQSVEHQWYFTPEDGGYWTFRIGHASVTLEKRPRYCDRGHWVGKAFGIDGMDGQDAFPRYYMNEARAKLELSEWLLWRLMQRRAESKATTP